MDSREEIIRHLQGANERIARYAEAYRALEHPDFAAVYPLAAGFVRDRFLLTREMCKSENLLDLADASLRFLLELKRRGIDAGEIARSCSGASSVISKKVLLIKAMQDVFDFSMTPEEFAGVTTVTELAEFICRSGGRQKSTAPVPAAGKAPAGFDTAAVRGDFPALSREIHGNPLIYLDNAATQQMPSPVLSAVEAVDECRGNIHRGVHTLGSRCTDAYERARGICARFLGAEPGKITFTAGTTDGVNRTAWALSGQKGGVVVTALEHHSNFVPWQQLCRRTGAPFRVCPILPDGNLDLAALERLLTEEIQVLAITQCSNVLGTVPPLEEIIPLAHSRGIRVFVDGAQAVCHRKVDVAALGCDWYVCSGHKLGGPFGTGLLYSREAMPHAVFGGGMVETVTAERTAFLPVKEAGTPNISGAVGLGAAIEYREALPPGWQAHEKKLLGRLRALLAEVPGVRLYGPEEGEGCLSFSLEGANALETAALLDQKGIAVRSGNHCAQPLHEALGVAYTLRVSPAFYNTPEEIDRLVSELRHLLKAI